MKKPGLLVRMRALQHAVVRSVRHAKASGLGPVQIMLKTVRAIRRGPRGFARHVIAYDQMARIGEYDRRVVATDKSPAI